MHRHGGRISQRVHAPDAGVEGLAAMDHVGVKHEKFQELEFFIRQHFLLAADEDAMGVGFQGNIADGDAFLLVRLPFEPLVLGQLGLHLRHQDAGRERLLDVVIGAKSQATDLIDVGALRRHHHDGHVDLVPKLPANLKSVHPRQHDVQKNEVIVSGHGFGEAAGAILLHLHLVAAHFQIVLLDGSDVVIVFDN